MKVKYFCNCRETTMEVNHGWISYYTFYCVDCRRQTVMEICDAKVNCVKCGKELTMPQDDLDIMIQDGRDIYCKECAKDKE